MIMSVEHKLHSVSTKDINKTLCLYVCHIMHVTTKKYIFGKKKSDTHQRHITEKTFYSGQFVSIYKYHKKINEI